MKRVLLILLATVLLGVASLRAEGASNEPAIKISRFMCYGSCPAYSMTVSSDGTFTGVGVKYVGTEGTVHGSLGPAAFERAIQALDRAD